MKAAFYPENYSDLPAVIKSIDERQLSSELDYEESAGSQYLLTFNVKRLSGFIIFLLVLFISLAMCMQIISVSSNGMKEQEQYFAMLRAIGIKKKELFSIVLIEHFITAVAASVIALGLSAIFLLVSDICFTKMLGNGINVSASRFAVISLRLVPAAVLGYILIISVIFAFEQRRTINDMLR